MKNELSEKSGYVFSLSASCTQITPHEKLPGIHRVSTPITTLVWMKNEWGKKNLIFHSTRRIRPSNFPHPFFWTICCTNSFLNSLGALFWKCYLGLVPQWGSRGRHPLVSSARIAFWIHRCVILEVLFGISTTMREPGSTPVGFQRTNSLLNLTRPLETSGYRPQLTHCGTPPK